MKKSRKPLAVALVCLILCLTLASCGQIEDTNGPDDITPVTITDEDIVKKSTSAVTSSQLITNSNGKKTVKVGKFSGVTELDSLRSDGKKVLVFTVKLTSGNLRLCLVRDGKIVAELPIDGSEHTVALPDDDRYSLRAAGESAKYTITYQTEDWPEDWDVNG